MSAMASSASEMSCVSASVRSSRRSCSARTSARSSESPYSACSPSCAKKHSLEKLRAQTCEHAFEPPTNVEAAPSSI